MKSPSQAKVSTISFLIALIVSLSIFGLVAYLAITGIMKPSETITPSELEQGEIPPDEIDTPDDPIDDPDKEKEIEGESFTVLVAGYDLQGDTIDAMVVLDVDKENKKATVYPINVDTKVYVGHGDSYSLNVRLGDLTKYRDMNYVREKVNATTGLKIEYYITFTAEGFITAFDEFNKNGNYVYTVPKDMAHEYTAEGDLAQYNIAFKKGDKLKSGIDVYNMLRYKGDSASERTTRQAAFVKDVITKIIPARFKEGNLPAILGMVKALVKLTDSITTNIDAETFITETYELISATPSFSLGTATKFTSGTTNFK